MYLVLIEKDQKNINHITSAVRLCIVLILVVVITLLITDISKGHTTCKALN